MGSNPINLIFRFILELCALTASGVWGWNQSDEFYRIVLCIGLPIILATIWGVFAVPNDPSRSGAAPIIISGIVRLTIELGIFAFSIWTLYNLGAVNLGRILGVSVLLHYILSYDRIIWLLAR